MRGRLGGLTGVALLLAMPATAFAQRAAFPDEPAPAKPAASSETENPAPPATDESESASALYDAAFAALARGERTEAARLLTLLHEKHAEDPLAAKSAELLSSLEQSESAEPKPTTESTPHGAPSEADAERKPTTAARAELLFFQTLHGIGLGAEACLIFECSDVRPWVVSLMVGAGTGLGLSLYLSSDGVTPGLARSLTSGTEWGLWNGLMLGLTTDAFQNTRNDGRSVGEGLALGQLAGLGTGALLYSALEPTAGQVSLTSSGGIWTTAVVGLSLGAFGAEPSGRTVAGVLLVASDVGLLGGGLLASQHPMSAGRVLLIDAGGLLGVLGGAGTGLLIGGENADAQVTSGLGLLGTVGGLSLAWFLTRNWDSTDTGGPKVSLGVVPVPHGAMGLAHVTF